MEAVVHQEVRDNVAMNGQYSPQKLMVKRSTGWMEEEEKEPKGFDIELLCAFDALLLPLLNQQPFASAQLY